MKLHTIVSNGGTRLARVLNYLALALLTCFSASSYCKAATAPLVSSNRFLFIIDASASMKPFDKGLRETVFDLIYSGMRGRMTNGDTYGIWVVQDGNDTSFKMETWKSHHAVEMGAKATAHVKDHGFKGKARLDLAMADARRVARNVGDLTIVLVSNGETPVSGTPFDGAINARFHELAPEMKRARATLNTVFVAQDKELVAWAANGPDFLLEVPRVAPRPKPSKPEITRLTTNAPAATNGVAGSPGAGPDSKSPLPLQNPRVAPNPIIITKETVAQEKRAWAAVTSTGTNDSNQPGTTNNAGPLIAQTNAPAAPSNSLATVATPAELQPSTSNVSATNTVITAFANPTPKPHTASTNQLASVEVIPNVKATEHAAAPRAAAAAIPSANGTGNEQNRPGLQPLVWIVAGATLAIACVLVGVLLARGHRREPSLISQAIAQQRVP